MTAQCCRDGWREGVFHGGSAMEADELARRGDFRPAGGTAFHGETASFCRWCLKANREYVKRQGVTKACY